MAVRTVRSATGKRASSGTGKDVPIRVKFCVMNDGIHPQCIRKGSTIAELFKQAGFDATKSLKNKALIRMDNRDITDVNTQITRDGAVITTTVAVKGGC